MYRNREISILIQFQHPTIIKFYWYSLFDFEGHENVTIIMYLSKKGSVAKLLENVRKGLADENYDNTSRQILLIGIARGMMFFHQHHIIHRDLKPDNILLDDNNYPLLIDFGLSKIPQFNFNSSSTKGCGTSIYMAPESISYNIYNEKTDVYSFGILMYQIVTDCKPYPILETKKITEFEFKKKVVEENYRPVFDSKLKIKKSIKNLIQCCWSVDPEKRPNFEDLFNYLTFNRRSYVIDIFNDTKIDNDDEKYFLYDVDKVIIDDYTKTIGEKQQICSYDCVNLTNEDKSKDKIIRRKIKPNIRASINDEQEKEDAVLN